MEELDKEVLMEIINEMTVRSKERQAKIKEKYVKDFEIQKGNYKKIQLLYFAKSTINVINPDEKDPIIKGDLCKVIDIDGSKYITKNYKTLLKCDANIEKLFIKEKEVYPPKKLCLKKVSQ